MKYTLCLFVVMSIMLTTYLPGGSTTAKLNNWNQDPSEPRDFSSNLPENAVIGSTPERRAAWESLSPKVQERMTGQFFDILNQAKEAEPPKEGTRNNSTMAFIDINGNRQLVQGEESNEAAQPITFVPSLNFETSINSQKRKLETECVKSVEQFIRDFYQGTLSRQPTGIELSQWFNLLTQAQTQGSAELLLSAQNLGGTLFHSQEYINRGRSDEEYVTDLFWGWLQREPDAATYQYRLTQLAHNGREYVLNIFASSGEFQNNVNNLCNASTYDGDGDGLPDYFENKVANAFTPLYFVSGEDTDNFASFNNSVPQTVQQLFGQTPFNHFRVKPLGFGITTTGVLVSVLRVDYLTLWNHDSGLVGGGLCFFSPLGLDPIISDLGAHNLDNERSAALIAAPVTSYEYNLDPNAYSAYQYFLSSHEGKDFVDQSVYIFPNSPVPAYYHINLYLARSKHGTYFFNPSGYPIFQWWFMREVYDRIDYLYYSGQIDYFTYLTRL